MINLTSFILGICLTSICFLIYLKYKKKTRGRKVIFHNLELHSGDVLPFADDTIIKNFVNKSYVDEQIEERKAGKPTSQDDLATPRYVKSQIKKGKGGIYQ